MSNLNKEQREKLPLSDFGEPDTRNFPIVDQDDVDSAAHLIGKAKNPGVTKRRIIRIAKRKGLTIPDAWKSAGKFSMDDMTDGDMRDSLNAAVADLSSTKSHYVTHVLPVSKKVVYTDGNDDYQQDFDFDENGNAELKGSPDKVNVKRRTSIEPIRMQASFSVGKLVGEYVELTGKMFELGVYPDKMFSLNEAEFDAMAPKFGRIELDLEHTGIKSLLGLPFGYTDGATRDGQDINGKVWVAKWLTDLVGEVVNTSFQFHPFTKEPIGCALVLDPRITDAEVTAAFSRYSESQRSQSGSKKTMNPLEKLAALFKKHPEAVSDVGFSQEDLDAINADKPQFSANDVAELKARIATLEATTGSLKTDVTEFSIGDGHKVAVEFAQRAIKDGRYYPFEQDRLAGHYLKLILADGGGVAKFSNGQVVEGPLAKDFREWVESRPKHEFSAGITGTETLKIVFSDPSQAKEGLADAQKSAYLAGTGTKDRVEAARKGA